MRRVPGCSQSAGASTASKSVVQACSESPPQGRGSHSTATCTSTAALPASGQRPQAEPASGLRLPMGAAHRPSGPLPAALQPACAPSPPSSEERVGRGGQDAVTAHWHSGGGYKLPRPGRRRRRRRAPRPCPQHRVWQRGHDAIAADRHGTCWPQLGQVLGD